MQDQARTWLQRQTTRWQDWPPERLVEAKRRTGTRISVVIPARNEERTVGRVVGTLRQALLVGTPLADTPLVDEIVVVDSDSTDGTARAAERAGATYSERCLGCHRWQSCGMARTMGGHIARNCIDCHMPLQETQAIVSITAGKVLHTSIRNHRIAVYPGQ